MSTKPSIGNTERQAAEFGVEIGKYRGVVRVPRRVFQRLLPERPSPERCVEAYYLQRTRFESMAEEEAAPAAVDRRWIFTGLDRRLGPIRQFLASLTLLTTGRAGQGELVRSIAPL